MSLPSLQPWLIPGSQTAYLVLSDGRVWYFQVSWPLSFQFLSPLRLFILQTKPPDGPFTVSIPPVALWYMILTLSRSHIPRGYSCRAYLDVCQRGESKWSWEASIHLCHGEYNHEISSEPELTSPRWMHLPTSLQLGFPYLPFQPINSHILLLVTISRLALERLQWFWHSLFDISTTEIFIDCNSKARYRHKYGLGDESVKMTTLVGVWVSYCLQVLNLFSLSNYFSVWTCQNISSYCTMLKRLWRRLAYAIEWLNVSWKKVM